MYVTFNMESVIDFFFSQTLSGLLLVHMVLCLKPTSHDRIFKLFGLDMHVAKICKRVMFACHSFYNCNKVKWQRTGRDLVFNLLISVLTVRDVHVLYCL